jgi:hypothetical protein
MKFVQMKPVRGFLWEKKERPAAVVLWEQPRDHPRAKTGFHLNNNCVNSLKLVDA